MAALPRIAERAPVRLPNAGRIPLTLLAAIALLVVAAVGVLQVMQTSQAATAGYELGALEAERADLSAQVRALEAQIAQSANEGQMRDLAIARLGMVPPAQTVRVTVGATAPALPALPERYVVRPQPTPLPPPSWWEQILKVLPGFN
jgi:cell division protein FtsL